MLLAFTGSPPCLATVTSNGAAAAVCAKVAAGRACNPITDSTVTFRSGIVPILPRSAGPILASSAGSSGLSGPECG
ncbi:hypothetical protein GCM10010106_37700 [Thermopolyspora flexuosa]|nr:hypothetical protein GCM10010106_37700 [Thermopolyspora flexuosa]